MNDYHEKFLRIAVMTVLAGVSVCRPLCGQLVITEVMSHPSQLSIWTNDAWRAFARADWVEVTNMGLQTNDLDGFQFIDSGGLANARALQPAIIKPGESVILFRQNNALIPDAAAFKRWWGTNLPDGIQILPYGSAGLNEFGEYAELFDPANNLVDRADFGEALRGHTFVYDTNAGCMCVVSQLGMRGAWVAPEGGDVGSPGWAEGPVAMEISGPQSLVVTGGMDAVLQVCATGLPKPRIQWYYNGTPIGPNSITANRLMIPNVTLENAGDYHAVLDNGFIVVTSSVATLTFVTQPLPPAILRYPEGVLLFPGQSWTLSVSAAGNPAPAYQWSLNGTNLAGETSPVLKIQDATSLVAGTYAVRMSNMHGTNVAYASVVFMPAKPRLRITEAMSAPRTNALVHDDWWELTNLDTFPVNLRGWRWDDDSFTIGSGPTIGLKETIIGYCGCKPIVKQEWYDVIIEPGESIIFGEATDAGAFKQWWGITNLPPGLKVFSFNANSLGEDGDSINLWNAAATDIHDLVDSLGFSTATEGVTRWFAGDCNDIGGLLSVAGSHGAFVASIAGDVGSPGWTPWTLPIITDVRPTNNSANISWRAPVGLLNTVQYAADLTNWISLGAFGPAHVERSTSIPVSFAPASLEPQWLHVRIAWQMPPQATCTNGVSGEVFTNIFSNITSVTFTKTVGVGLWRNQPLSLWWTSFSTWGTGTGVKQEWRRYNSIAPSQQINSFVLGEFLLQPNSAAVVISQVGWNVPYQFYRLKTFEP